MERREKKDCSWYRGCKLFLSEDGLEVMGVDCGIASIPVIVQGCGQTLGLGLVDRDRIIVNY